VIVFDKLRKLYGDFCALDGLDCTIPNGATVGLIGSNGAGKTTSMRLLTTLITPRVVMYWLMGYQSKHNPISSGA
jgi:ABC-2 type transport system ATP-binding protein